MPNRIPDDLPEWAKDLWIDSVAALQKQETWRDEQWPEMERYIRMVVLGRAAREERDGELTSVGVSGQLREHPLIKVERQAYQDAEQYAVELLLTPRSRRRAEVAASSSGDQPSVLDSIFAKN
jgi:phage terminase small subunit